MMNEPLTASLVSCHYYRLNRSKNKFLATNSVKTFLNFFDPILGTLMFFITVPHKVIRNESTFEIR